MALLPKKAPSGDLLRALVEDRILWAALRAVAKLAPDQEAAQAALDASLEGVEQRLLAELGPNYDLALRPLFARVSALALRDGDIPSPP